LNAFTSLLTSVLDWIYSFVGDYGWSIVIFTVLFRVCLSPLDYYSRRAMKRQSDLTPAINALQKKYANDREKLARKQQELYKANGVNPLAGCLPLLIQLPLFFAFFAAIRTVSANGMYEVYSTLKETGEVALPGFYWVHNLWAADNIWDSVVPAFETLKAQAAFADVTDYDTIMAGLKASYEGVKNGWLILPVLSAVFSYLQSVQSQKYNPTPKKADGSDSNVMMKWMMPIMSLFFCCTSSAAFSLYWIASSVAMIVISFIINKMLLAKSAKLKLIAEEEAANPVIEVPETRRERRERMRREAEEAAAAAASEEEKKA